VFQWGPEWLTSLFTLREWRHSVRCVVALPVCVCLMGKDSSYLLSTVKSLHGHWHCLTCAFHSSIIASVDQTLVATPHDHRKKTYRELAMLIKSVDKWRRATSPLFEKFKIIHSASKKIKNRCSQWCFLQTCKSSMQYILYFKQHKKWQNLKKKLEFWKCVLFTVLVTFM
jgi:hypothetical protein